LQEKEKKEEAAAEAKQALLVKEEPEKRPRSKPAPKRQKRTSPRLRGSAKTQPSSNPIEVKLVKDNILDVAQFKLRSPNVKGFLTDGLAPFDVEHCENELLASNYITDICQHLYNKEVSSFAEVAASSTF
jgi:hypothetical protein